MAPRSVVLALALFRAASATITVACAGDSTTEGNAAKGVPYDVVLQDFLGDGFEVKNWGEGGRTVVDHRGRAYRDTEVYAELLETGFDVLIITLGTNDAKANDEYTYWHDEATWLEEYLAMLDDIVAAVPGVTAIYVGTPAPIYGDGNYAEEFAYSRDVVHDTLQRLARDVVADLAARVDFYVGLVDFFEALGGDDPIDEDYKDAARTPGPTFSQTRRPTTS